MTRLLLVLYLVAVASSSFGQPTLSPAAFPELPKNIRADLQKRRCRIPQIFEDKRRANVIHGEFAKPGQTDWAVLCQIGRTTSILIFWNGSEIDPTRLASSSIDSSTEFTEDGRTGNIRGISTVGKRQIMASYRLSGGTKPPLIDHQGIDDGLAGKASSINYFYRGKWIGWTSSD
jgi:hypothetical protein